MTGGAGLVVSLRRRGIVDERVLAAIGRVPRERFVPPQLRRRAYDDCSLPIGFDQTISQPFMVALICAALRLEGHERVLDVGTGSGYQAAVLAELAAEVVSIELIPELAREARERLEQTGYGRVVLRLGDGTLGVPDRAPYDAIAVAAAAPAVPAALYDQLAAGGRIAVPVGGLRDQWLEVVERGRGGATVARSVPCRFVPLLGAAGFRRRRVRCRLEAFLALAAGGSLLVSPGSMQRSSALRASGALARTRGALSRRRNWVQLAKFSTVGASGYVINLAIYAILIGAGLHYLLAATGSFLVAVASNYTWNRLWTFRGQRGHVAYQGLRFLVVSAVALCANLVILHLLVQAMDRELLPQAIAIVLVTPLNFIGNKLWSFGRR